MPETVASLDIPKSEMSGEETNLTKIEPIKTNKKMSLGKMIAPVDGEIIRAFSNKSGGNEGIDYKVVKGTRVKAAAKGTVALISKSVGDTTIILLRHEDNLYTVY